MCFQQALYSMETFVGDGLTLSRKHTEFSVLDKHFKQKTWKHTNRGRQEGLEREESKGDWKWAVSLCSTENNVRIWSEYSFCK